MDKKVQCEAKFFNGPAPSLEERARRTDRALSVIIGNATAKDIVRDPLIVCQERSNHDMSDLNMAFIGPAGTGKSTFPEAINAVAGLPYAKIVAGSLSSVEDVWQRMKIACAEYDNGLPK